MDTYDSDNPYANDDEYDPYRDNDDNDPYRQDFNPPKKRSADSSKKWTIGCIVGIGFFFFCLCCGGFGSLATIGFDMQAGEVKVILNQNPIVKENIGEITDCEVNLLETSQSGANTDVFDFKGEKASGQAVVTFNEDRSEIIKGDLILDNGKRIDLFPAPPAFDDSPDVDSEIAPPAPNAPPTPIEKKDPPKKESE